MIKLKPKNRTAPKQTGDTCGYARVVAVNMVRVKAYAAIADALGVDRGTVSGWLDAYDCEDLNGLGGARSGRPPFLSCEKLKKISAMPNGSPPTSSSNRSKKRLVWNTASRMRAAGSDTCVPQHETRTAVSRKERRFGQTDVPVAVFAVPECSRGDAALGKGRDTPDVPATSQELFQAEGDARVRVA